MKKLFSFVFVILLCVASFAFTACNQPEAISETPDTSTDSPTDETEEPKSPLDVYEIGHQLLVYPDCEFDYKVNDECIVHISEITVTLTEINYINEGDLITDEYYSPYVFLVKATGVTDSKFANNKIYLHLRTNLSGFTYVYQADIESDGSIIWEYDQYRWCFFTDLYFSYVSLS